MLGGEVNIRSNGVTWNDELEAMVQKNWQPGDVFRLDDVYKFEKHFSDLHPENTFVRDKLRQTLQNLRDSGVIEFVDDRGTYRRMK